MAQAALDPELSQRLLNMAKAFGEVAGEPQSKSSSLVSRANAIVADSATDIGPLARASESIGVSQAMLGDCLSCQRGAIPILCGKREQLNVERFKFVFFYDACEPFLCFRPQIPDPAEFAAYFGV
jgi:hypothetical protein